MGDALLPEASLPDGFAGIVVDLFGLGDVLEPLKQVHKES